MTTTLRELCAQVQLTLCIDVWALPLGQMLRRVGLPLTAPLTAATMALEGPSSRNPAPLCLCPRVLLTSEVISIAAVSALKSSL